MADNGAKKFKVTIYRRASQGAFLALFLVLYRLTDYRGKDQIDGAVNIFFRWDPLVAASTSFASGVFDSLLLPSLIVVALTLVLGRFFCNWVCPMGTLLDVSHRWIKPKTAKGEHRFRLVKYFLLATVLLSAIIGSPTIGYLDPFSILVRGLTLSVEPAFVYLVSAPFDFFLRHDILHITKLSEPLYAAMKNTILPFRNPAYSYSLISGSILVAVFALEKLERRFWCRNLCPLGAMLGLIAKVAPLKFQPGKACLAGGCSTCVDVCRMGTINAEGFVSQEECTLCLDCQVDCPREIISFGFKKSRRDPVPVGIGRRAFGGMMIGGLAVPAFLKASTKGMAKNPHFIRPPGALEEKEFKYRCVRCGECMKVCITNALNPTLLEAGADGMFSPTLVARIGYCEYDCTLCGQVCPTGAIKKLDIKTKHETRIGLAYFDKSRCLPWSRGVACIVCEEMCPTPDKAIKLHDAVVLNQRGEEMTVQQPYIIDQLCIGCGKCEAKCPVSGTAAVIVTNEGETRDPNSVIPSSDSPY